MSAAGKRHIGRVKSLPCVVCGEFGPSDAHHIRTGQGMSQRANDFLAIPLCKPCHQGPNGLHGDRALWKIYKMTELDALARTIEELTK